MFRRKKKIRSNRDRKQNDRRISEDKLLALEGMFKGMTPHEIVQDLNKNWVDGRWRIVIIDKSNIICDDTCCFEGWRVYG